MTVVSSYSADVDQMWSPWTRWLAPGPADALMRAVPIPRPLLLGDGAQVHVNLAELASHRAATSDDDGFVSRVFGSWFALVSAVDVPVLLARCTRVVSDEQFLSVSAKLCTRLLASPALVELWQHPLDEVLPALQQRLAAIENPATPGGLSTSAIVSLVRLVSNDPLTADDAGTRFGPLLPASMWRHRRHVDGAMVAVLRDVVNNETQFSAAQALRIRPLVLSGALDDAELFTLLESCAHRGAPGTQIVTSAVLEAAVVRNNAALVAASLSAVSLVATNLFPPTALVFHRGLLLSSDLFGDDVAEKLLLSSTPAAVAEALMVTSGSRRRCLLAALVASPVMFGEVDALLLQHQKFDPVAVAGIVDEFLAAPGGLRRALDVATTDTAAGVGPSGAVSVEVMRAVEELCDVDVSRWATFLHVHSRHAGTLAALRTVIVSHS